MLYILPTVVLQVEAYLYYETPNKTILSLTLSGVIELSPPTSTKCLPSSSGLCMMMHSLDESTVKIKHCT